MSWVCSNCGRTEGDSVECVMNRETRDTRHLHACHAPTEEEKLRESAEKNRRGLEILEKKSQQHGAQVCTTDGNPPDPDYAELGNAPKPIKDSGQHESYYVLCESERQKGFVRPVRRTYIHEKCGTSTSMGQALAETYARDPHFYGATFCCKCGGHFPVGPKGEFRWEDGEKVGA